MNVLWIAFVSALSALIAAIAGPVVSYVVARRQITASVISNNRERWVEALRDTIAEYVALLVSAAMVKQTIDRDDVKAIAENAALLRLVERMVLAKNKIMLMTNPNEHVYMELCAKVEASYRSLVSTEICPVEELVASAEAVTDAGRAVLKTEWKRIKRGE